MRRSHEDELAEIADTYACVRSTDLPDLVEVISRLSKQDVVYVGSGGMLAVARLASDLHCIASRHVSVAATPLQAAAGVLSATNAVVLLSSRAKHPDVLATARAARLHGDSLVVLLTQRGAADLPPDLRASVDTVVTIPSPHPDGFLSTNGVVSFATAIIGAYGVSLPPDLPAIHAEFIRPSGWDAERWLVTYASGARAAAEDLEARLSETGLRDVQLADLRNVAHGRHVGLERLASRTLVVALSGPEGRSLAERTLKYLPAGISRHFLGSNLTFPAGGLDLMVAGIKLAGQRALDDGYDIGRPRVAEWGRRLYHLRWSSKNVLPPLEPRRNLLNEGKQESPLPLPITMKMRAAGISLSRTDIAEGYRGFLRTWLDRRDTQDIGAVVLDYDGTCCTTAGRFDPPPKTVQNSLLRLLHGGIILGFATGRGRSLIHGTEGLRQWIPQEYWSDVIVGLYNGGLLLQLSEDVPKQTDCTGDLASAADLLDSYAGSFGWRVDRRIHQVTVEATDSAANRGEGIAALVQSLLSRRYYDKLKLVTSGHSVDVLSGHTTKRLVMDRVGDLLRQARDVEATTLVIGDSGQQGGNDFEMLSAVSSSLSVGTCSPDPDRCWNLGSGRESGPQLLVQYLDALDIKGRGIGRFEWPR